MKAKEIQELDPTFTLESVLLIMVGAVFGALIALVVLPNWLNGLTFSLDGANPKAYWYLARAAGITAYLILWLSVAFGLLITNKMSRAWPGGPTAVDTHQFLSLFALAVALFHVLILLGDRYSNYSLTQLFTPFATTNYRPLWVGLGQIGFYLALPIAFSFYARKHIGYRAWRTLHFMSFVLYLLVAAHGLFAGTDALAPLPLALYGGTSLIIYFLIVFRLLVSIKTPRPAMKEAHAPAVVKK